jgi:hypothetical protein
LGLNNELYGIYYPQPFLNQILRELPIAVVDNDLSDLSRQIVETLDASGALSVAVRARTLAEARAAIDRGSAFAVVEIPPGTERDMLKGITAHIPVYADATYLFIFRSTASGVATAVGAFDVRSRFARRALGRKPRQGEIGEREPGRRSAAADLQPGGRLRELPGHGRSPRPENRKYTIDYRDRRDRHRYRQELVPRRGPRCARRHRAHWAAKAREALTERPKFVARTRRASAAVMCGLGAALLIARRAS